MNRENDRTEGLIKFNARANVILIPGGYNRHTRYCWSARRSSCGPKLQKIYLKL